MFQNTSLYLVEERVGKFISKKLDEIKLPSCSEDNGLEHYMNFETKEDGLITHNFEIGVQWNYKFAKKLSKKIWIHLQELYYFLDDYQELKGYLSVFLAETSSKYHIDSDGAISALTDPYYYRVWIQQKLEKNPNYLFNVFGNKYTLKDNTSHLTLFEILQSLNLKFGYHRISPPKRYQRHKGYRDHGSLQDESTKARKAFKDDFTVQELQNKLEERRKEQADLADLIKGFLQ